MPDGDRFNPFPGLRPFEPEEDHLFFGREKHIDDLLRRLRSSRFLSVVGTSGSGKSSLVRSGLIPSLQSGYMAKAGSSWRIATLRPGEDPIGHLATALNAPDVLGTEGELASTNRILIDATLHRSTLGLVQAVRQARIPPHENILVVVDQFEELFRFGPGHSVGSTRDEAMAFVKLLLEAKQQDEFPIYIVITMRSDFIGECMEFPGLPETVNSSQYLVPRMTRDELRSTITGPVAVGGAEIAARLVLRLLNEVGNDHDQLPVLQHALMRTWDHWQRRQKGGPSRLADAIDISDYDAIGTMSQALSLHAEEAYRETGPERKQKIAERMFKALTDTFSDPRGIRRPTSVKQLAAICEVSEAEIIQIVEIFRRTGRSFLMPPPVVPLDSRSIVDVSHESLMRCWTRLITWAEEERLSARAYARVSQASAWFEEGTAGLWHNPELQLGLRWRLENFPTEAWAERYNSSFARAISFLDRSEKEQQRVEAEREKARKNKLRLAWFVAGALAILLLVALSFYYVARVETARAEANLQLARKAVDESLSSAGRQQAREAADLPQLEQFRQELLKKAEDFYSNFLAKQSKNDAGFRADSAMVHSKLGDINRLLEKRDDAVAQYKLAIGGFEALRREKPGNAEYRQGLAYAHNWLGETLRGSQDKPDSHSDPEPEYNVALQLQQDLHDQMPQSADYQQELARTHYNRGILRFAKGDAKASESDFTEAIRLLEPLAKKELEVKAKKGENPPSHDLARVYNNYGTLLSSQGDLARAQDFSERAIRIQKELMTTDSDNWEYRVELATFYNNLAFLSLAKGDVALAEQQNHAALDSIETLAEPSPSMETERAKAHMLYLFLGPGRHHPEFHVLYKNLGQEYLHLATTYFQAGSPDAARLAIQSLERVLPEIAEPDRTRIEKSYRDIQQQLKGKVK
jgi:tetratricopeptide (TPR) repeat protein